MGVTGGLTHHIQRCALTLGDGLDVIQMPLVDEQSHALLALVGDDFLGTERLVTNRQLGHINLSAAVFHEFRQTVQVTGTAMVMDRHHRIFLFLHQGAHQVVGTLLHFRVCTLYSVQLNAAGVPPCVNG